MFSMKGRLRIRYLMRFLSLNKACVLFLKGIRSVMSLTVFVRVMTL